MKKQVKCPHCKHRLFDAVIEGELEIKCPRCKTTVTMRFTRTTEPLRLEEKKISYLVKHR